jgi:drug/metabolite transporter (DMT)-like permease
VLPALITTLLFSVSAVAANRTSRLLGGVEANFWRILLATLFLALLASVFGVGLAGPSLKIFFVSGLIGFGVGDLALYQALPRIGSRLSIMLVHCLAAPLAAVVEWVWLGTKITFPEALCGVVILSGVALALAPSEHIHLPRAALVFGVLMGVVAAIGQGMGAVLSRKAYDVARAASFHIDGITAAYQRILGGLLVAVISVALLKLRRRETTPPHDWKAALPWVLANVAAGPSLGVACFQWALSVAPTAIVLPIVALTPLTIIPMSWKIEGERPSVRSIAGGAVAVAGVIGLTLTRLK